MLRLFAIAIFVLEASAFWRLPCRQALTIERIDPLTDFGGVAEHVHAIHGGNRFGRSSSEKDLLESSCSSCQVKQDKSAYWAPALYFQDGAGNFKLVDQIGGMLVYYLPRGNNVKAFPPNFRMIAGDGHLRSFPYHEIEKSSWTAKDKTEDALRQKAIAYTCLNYDQPANAALTSHALPKKPLCKDGLRTEVFFPSCWNGMDLDSDNHRDHMRYPDLMDTGECPDGFKTRLVSLFFETIWGVDKFRGQEGQFVWSTGDPTGYGYHADFMNAWQVDVLQEAIDTCTSDTGLIEECGVFKLSSESEMKQCTIKRSVDEDVFGPIKELPGCNPVEYGPEKVKKGGCKGNDKGKVSPTNPPTPTTTKPTEKPKGSPGPAPYNPKPDPHNNLPNYNLPDISPPFPPPPAPEPTTTTPSTIPHKQDPDPHQQGDNQDPYLVIVTITSYVTPPVQTTVYQHRKRGLHNHHYHH